MQYLDDHHRRSRHLGDNHGLAQGRTDVGIFTCKVARRLEVADSKDWRDVRANVGQGVTYLNRAADRKGVFPDDLGEVTPFLEVGHVRVVISVSRIEPDLVVVHQVGDQLVSLVGEKPSTDVLAIATTAGLSVVCINA